MVMCPDCGKDVPEAKFCKNCGAYISDIKEVGPAVESESMPADDSQSVSPDVSQDVPFDDSEAIPAESGIKDSSQVPVQSANKLKFCFNCGCQLDGNYKFCPDCGQDLNGEVSTPNSHYISTNEKNTLLAVILSVLLPGLGQIYLNLDHKGAIFLIAYVISAILILIVIGFILCFVIWIWALVDTIMSANAINRGEEVIDKLL